MSLKLVGELLSPRPGGPGGSPQSVSLNFTAAHLECTAPRLCSSHTMLKLCARIISSGCAQVGHDQNPQHLLGSPAFSDMLNLIRNHIMCQNRASHLISTYLIRCLNIITNLYSRCTIVRLLLCISANEKRLFIGITFQR